MTKEKLELMIDNVLLGLDDPEKVKQASVHYRKYNELYGFSESGEEDIADAVFKYPELHPKMIAIVEKIVAIIRSGKVFSLWLDDETQAGELIAYMLAMYDKKYCYVYAKSLLHQDLDHEVNQNDAIMALIEKWGFCKEIGLVLAARGENLGADGNDFIDEILEEYDDVAEEVMKNGTVEFLINEYGRGIIFASLLFEYNTKNLPLLIKAVNFCDSDRVAEFEGCENYLSDDYFPEHGFTPEISELLVSNLLKSEYGINPFEDFEELTPSISQIMKKEEKCTLFLEDIAKWLDSDIPAAKDRRKEIFTKTNSFVERTLTKVFEIVFAFEFSDAEKAADKYIEIYKSGAVPKRVQIVG